jgi:hypothetical protein
LAFSPFFMILFTTEVTAGCPLAGNRVGTGSGRCSGSPNIAVASALCVAETEVAFLRDGCVGAADEVVEGAADDWRRADPTKETAWHGKQVRAGI